MGQRLQLKWPKLRINTGTPTACIYALPFSWRSSMSEIFRPNFKTKFYGVMPFSSLRPQWKRNKWPYTYIVYVATKLVTIYIVYVAENIKSHQCFSCRSSVSRNATQFTLNWNGKVKETKQAKAVKHVTIFLSRGSVLYMFLIELQDLGQVFSSDSYRFVSPSLSALFLGPFPFTTYASSGFTFALGLDGLFTRQKRPFDHSQIPAECRPWFNSISTLWLSTSQEYYSAD